VRHDSERFTNVGRIGLMLIGLWLADGFRNSTALPVVIVSTVGVIIFLAASGAVELGMALWYRLKRRRLARH